MRLAPTVVGRLVVIQPGDSGDTFLHPSYRRLVANAIAWVSSGPAKVWAGQQGKNLDIEG